MSPQFVLMPDRSQGASQSAAQSDLDAGHQWLRSLHALKDKIGLILESKCDLPGLERPLTFGQFKLMQHIDEGCADDGSWSLQRLAEALQISLPAVSKNLARLTPLGLVEIRADRRDGRKRRVFLTPDGEAALNLYKEWRSERLREMVEMSEPGEIQNWTRCLDAMVERIQTPEEAAEAQRKA